MELDMELKPLGTRNKVKGGLSIAIGILFLFSLFFLDPKKIIIPITITEDVPARYFVPILIVNCAIYLVVFGVLSWSGRMSGSSNGNISDSQKAKQRLLRVLVSTPLWVALGDLLFFVAESKVWKVFGGAMFAYILWLFVSSFRALRGKKFPGSLQSK
jgi:hypothetical protein